MINTEYYKDLTKMNTFGMKVKARCFIEYDSVADLVDIEFSELARPVLHIGGGSNLLFTDDFKGTVLHSKINFIEILDDCHFFRCRSSDFVDCDQAKRVEKSVLVSVGAGVVFDDFCAWAAKEGLWGVENLSYIPGEVGASAVQNIGAYGVEVKDVIRKVYCYDTVEEEFVSFGVEECGYGYRDSIFKNPEIKGRYIVTHVVFALSREPQPRLDYGHLRDAVVQAAAPTAGTMDCQDGHAPDCHFDRAERVEKSITPSLIRKVIIKIRKEKLPEPSVMGSAGSFFKNPVISLEHFQRIEAAAKAEFGPDYKVPHYVIPVESAITQPDMAVISSAAGHSVISSEAGHSVISSEAGHSVISSDAGHSVISSAAGHSVISSAAGHSVISSDAGHPVISSDAGHSVISSAAGHSVISSEAEGRVEKSPLVKVPAAWMIEQCGWKGRRSGGAAVWDKQPLVLVNYTGEAYPEEIIGLERRIMASVKEKFGVELHPEVEHI